MDARRPRHRAAAAALLLAAGAPAASGILVVVGAQTGVAPQNGVTRLYELQGDGTLLFLKTAALGASPSWLVASADGATLYAGVAGAIVSADLDVGGRNVSAPTGSCDLSDAGVAGANTPVHFALHPDGTSLVSVSYGQGSVSVVPLNESGAVAPRPSWQAVLGDADGDATNAHEVVFVPGAAAGAWNLFVPTLGDDSVRYGATTPGGNVTLRPAGDRLFLPGAAFVSPPGNQRPGAVGPRHLAFHPSRAWAYVLNELNSTVLQCAYDAAAGTLTPIAPFVPTLRAGFPTAAALASGVPLPQQASEIVVHPSGGFVYVSNRGTATPDWLRGPTDADAADNSIAVFRVDAGTGALSLVGHETGGGDLHFPRHFALTPDGAFMVVASQRGDSLTTFALGAGGATLRKVQTVLVGLNAAPAFVLVVPDRAAVAASNTPQTIGFSVLGAVLGFAFLSMGCAAVLTWARGEHKASMATRAAAASMGLAAQ